MTATLPFAALVLALLAGDAIADPMAASQRARSGSFDATGEIACAQEVGQALGTCEAAVARAGGSAVLVVRFANGFARTLTFEDGHFQRANPTMSGVGTDTDWRRDGGLFHIRVDDQRFEVPEALVLSR